MRVVAGFVSYVHLRSLTWRKRVACKLVPDWFDRFAELNRLRSQNQALLARIKTISERSEDRDFADAFERLTANEPGEGEPPSRWSVASDIMDGSR